MATMISDIVATGWKGGVCAMAGLARRSNARIRIYATLPGFCRDGLRPPTMFHFEILGGHRPPLQDAEYESNRGLLILFLGVRFKGIRGRHEELSPVQEGKIPAVEAPQAVFREIASDDDLRSQGQRILIE